MEKRYGFDKALIRILCCTVVPVLKIRYGVKNKGKLSLGEEPCVVLFNHVTDLDAVWVMDAFKKQMYCVASEHVLRTPFFGKLLNVLFAPVFIKKGASGAGAVMEIIRHLKSGHCILMAPEGVKSGNGLTNPLVPSTAAVLKKMKCKIVTVRIHGGYFTNPRWGKGIRRGFMSVEKVREYTKEETARMTPEQLHDMIKADLFEDAYAFNAEKKAAYRGKNLAEGIGEELFLCPCCQKFFSIHSKGRHFFCDCGMQGTMNEYGLLKGKKLPFSTITEWDLWQSDYISKARDSIVLTSPGQAIRVITREHKNYVLDKGDLTLTCEFLKVGEKKIPVADIVDISYYGYGILLIFTTSGDYYEIRGEERYPGVAYYKFIQKIKET